MEPHESEVQTMSAQTQTEGQITIRRMNADGADRRALVKLAALDSHPPLDGEILGAVVENRLLAAISLTSGDLIADPFARTSELGRLLEMRAGQLRAQRPRRSRWTRRPRPQRREPRIALGGSPPGEILTLMRAR
jgi:hypothetical protein